MDKEGHVYGSLDTALCGQPLGEIVISTSAFHIVRRCAASAEMAWQFNDIGNFVRLSEISVCRRCSRWVTILATRPIREERKRLKSRGEKVAQVRKRK